MSSATNTQEVLRWELIFCLIRQLNQQKIHLPPHTQEHPTIRTGVRLQAQLLIIIINNTLE